MGIISTRKKTLIAITFALLLSGKAFAGFGVGIKAGGDLGNYNYWRVGATMGIGEMQGKPFIIDVLFHGQNGALLIKPTFDWHALTLNMSIIQLYMGLGIGTEFLVKAASWRIDDPFGFVLSARIPLGLKIFLKPVELFAEVTPQLGWEHVSITDLYYGQRISSNGFYWSIGLHAGARVWF